VDVHFPCGSVGNPPVVVPVPSELPDTAHRAHARRRARLPPHLASPLPRRLRCQGSATVGLLHHGGTEAQRAKPNRVVSPLPNPPVGRNTLFLNAKDAKRIAKNTKTSQLKPGDSDRNAFEFPRHASPPGTQGN
jgi:hypothetical protein